MKRLFFIGLLATLAVCNTQGQQTETSDTKAGTRWWWMGSAVDTDNLRWSLKEYARAGVGTVEITPIYGVQGNEKKELEYLSPTWMAALREVQLTAAENGIEVDMNNGTGWPFGGPDVPIEEAACKVVFVDTLLKALREPDVTRMHLQVPEKERPYAKLQCIRAFPTSKEGEWRVIAVYLSRTRQKVKRAAPGGEGYVIDHFDSTAVRHYLDRFERAFATTNTPYPHTFFNDSYEVYRANWTPTLFEEFAQRRGYRLEDHLPELLGYQDDGNQVLSDYRETLSELLEKNFTRQWVEWAHRHGTKVRNQAHGSPANLLDLYAAVDIPETEGFGLSDFGIKGLRTDKGMTKKNYSDVSMLKYASSAAHVSGKKLTSSETFTWLTEHFRTSLSQMKPDLDLMFTCGVNRVFFHGTCYSPKEEAWPGWKFYASVDMSPTNSIWRDVPYLTSYIERCQQYLQDGKPDNDFLVYLPVRDMWHQRLEKGEKGLLMMFDIHKMSEKSPAFIRSILQIDSLGYDCDYISDRQLEQVTMKADGSRLVTSGGSAYRGIIIPSGTTVTPRLQALLKLWGPLVVWGEDATAMAKMATAEPMRTECGLRTIRRQNDNGHHYFIANLTPRDVCRQVPLAVPCTTATWYDPLNGETKAAEISHGKVLMNFRSGESRILITSKKAVSSVIHKEPTRTVQRDTIDLTPLQWTLAFTEETPQVGRQYQLKKLQTWETLDESTKVTMGTGVYTTTFNLKRKDARRHWQIELGDVRESARVYVNGAFIGCAWAVPFVLDCKNTLHQGQNTIRIEVTNLPANRIADMDRRGMKWRKMKDINIVDINYKKSDYRHWKPMRSGLNGNVLLTTTD